MNVRSRARWKHESPVKTLQYQLSGDTPLECSVHNHSATGDTTLDMHFELESGIVVSGVIERSYEGFKATLSKGDIWFCGMWEPHGYRIVKAPCTVIVFVISPEYLSRLSVDEKPTYDWLAPFVAPAQNRPRTTAPIRPAIDTLTAQITHAASLVQTVETSLLKRLYLQQLLLLACSRWSRPAVETGSRSEPFKRIARALELVQRSRTPVRVTKAARECGLSRNAFSDHFTQAMGISFARFSRRYRLKGAARQISETNLPLKAIALDWGFTDISHLHRCFAEDFGCTPNQYRERKSNRSVP